MHLALQFGGMNHLMNTRRSLTELATRERASHGGWQSAAQDECDAERSGDLVWPLGWIIT
jgi:hypothetical protein